MNQFPFPDIGKDPLRDPFVQRGNHDDIVSNAIDRLRLGVDKQQEHAPDQTMLAWRIDVSRLISEYTWRFSALAAWMKIAKERERELQMLRGDSMLLAIRIAQDRADYGLLYPGEGI